MKDVGLINIKVISVELYWKIPKKQCPILGNGVVIDGGIPTDKIQGGEEQA